MFATNMCYYFIKSVMQDYSKPYLDAYTSIDSKTNHNCCIHRLKYNKVAMYYMFMHSNNKVCINVMDYTAQI